jgi:large subunit ribosomal protein L28
LFYYCPHLFETPLEKNTGFIMTLRCSVTGKVALVGNNVSHANNRTKRRFLPSVKTTRLYSEALRRMVPVKVSVRGLRSVEHKGGLDAWLLGTAPSRLPDCSLLPLREQIKARTKETALVKAKFRKGPSARAKKMAATKKAAK